MNWKSVRFDWNRARAFLVTAEEGSLSAAAKALGVSQPTLGRQVSALEEELSTVLFEKSGRGLALTRNGLELLSYVRSMGQAASDLSLAAAGKAKCIEGEVTISASEITAAYILPAIIENLRKNHPGIRVNLVAANDASDLRRQVADIAIRNFRPTEQDLIARKLGNFEATLYATRGLLNSRKQGEKTTDYGLPFIGFLSNNDLYSGALAQKQILTVDESFVAKTDNHLVHWQLAQAGIGIGMAPIEIGDSTPDMARVFPEKIFGGEVWLVSHRELRLNLRLRMVFDFLSQALSDYFSNG